MENKDDFQMEKKLIIFNGGMILIKKQKLLLIYTKTIIKI